MDPSRSDTQVTLPTSENEEYIFDIVEVICYRGSIRGRATEVLRIKRQSQNPPPVSKITAQSTPANAPRSSKRRGLTTTSFPLESASGSGTTSRPASHRITRSVTKKQATELEDIAPDVNHSQLERPSYEVHELVNLLDTMILKDSWPLTARCKNERDLFIAVKGYSGVPHILATYEVYHKKQGDHSSPTPLSTSWHVPKDRIYKLLEGLVHLLEGLVHAMIGYLNMFQKDWQHRDVSNTNIMLIEPQTVAEYTKSDDEMTRFTVQRCCGVLTDGDQAVKLHKARDMASHRSGTLPFISREILKRWDHPAELNHTALDDLESFFWVFLWETLQKGEALELLSSSDSSFLKAFRNVEPGDLGYAKGDFLGDMIDPIGYDKSFLKDFLGLLNKWATIRQAAYKDFVGLGDPSRKDIKYMKNMKELCLKTGRAYVEAGLAFLPQLADHWPAVPKKSG
ncbi:hypothetical protein C8R43DRAFT_1228935 [Mycena crocata]|nr:hypothetical protein C8R43DRAFT_1228935 [Mycena crocata]